MSVVRVPRAKWAWSALYCMSEGPGLPIKIGISARPLERLNRMRGETWRDLQIAWTVPGLLHHERQAHAALSNIHIRGEWFHDPDDWVKGLAPRTADELVDVLRSNLRRIA